MRCDSASPISCCQCSHGVVLYALSVLAAPPITVFMLLIAFITDLWMSVDTEFNSNW